MSDDPHAPAPTPIAAPQAVITPIDERRVNFYGDELTAVLVQQDGQERVFVPLRPISDYLGLSWSSQLQRTRHDSVLNESVISVLVSNTQIGRGKRSRAVLCVPLDLLPGWLFGLDASRVKPELQAKILQYRRECFRVLWSAFQAEAVSATGIQQVRSDAIAALERVRETGRALMQLAEQQLEIERRQATTEQRLDRAAVYMQNVERRLSVVEKRTAPETVISEAQAAQVANHVRALAEHLTQKDNSKNWYQSIFNALYRHFDVASYQRIRKSQYEQVMQTLEGWREAADTNRQLSLFD